GSGWAVITRTGRYPSCSRSFSPSITWNPSMPGIWRSSTIRSWRFFSCRPCTACGSSVDVTDAYPAPLSMRSSSRTLAGRSSTIRILALRISEASSMCVRGVQGGVQRRHELRDLDRFGEIGEESRLEAFRDVAWHRIGAEGHDGNVGRRRVVAQDLHRFDPADPGEIDVHQDHVRLMGARQLNALITVHGGQQP